jgi:hypothetical protein
MEEEELEIRRLIVRKSLDLVLAEHMKIDVEQFKALKNEFRQVLKKKLSKKESETYIEFIQQVDLCLKLVRKCPTKELLENEVREKIEELCPQVTFE